MKTFFFINGSKVETTQDRLNGQEIKIAGQTVDPSLDISYELVLEATGGGADEVIANDKEVELVHGHGQGPKHFFTRPPTNFGAL